MDQALLNPARGDAELAARLVEELGVATSQAAPGDAAWGDYFSHLVGRTLRGIFGFLSDAVDALPLPLGWPRVLALLVVAVATALVAMVVWRALRDRRRKRRRAAEGSTEVIAASVDPEERDAAAWRAELDRLLAAGATAEALRATWWWLARAVAGERADPSWTGRELLERSGRRDLLPIVRRLETFTYGGRRPGAEELRGLAAEIQGTVA